MKPSHLSMKWKLTIATSALIAAISIFTAAGIYYYMKRDYLAAITGNRVLVVNNLAMSAFEALLREDVSTISFLGEQFGRGKDVLSVVVMDGDDRVVYDSRHRLEGRVFKEAPAAPYSKSVVMEGKEGVEVSVPFNVGEVKWATAKVVYSMESVNKGMTSILITVSFFGILGIAMGVLVTSILARWITLPLEEITRGINAIEEGDLDYRIYIESRDELEMVGKEFNSMAERLKEVQAELTEKERMAAVLELAGAAAHEMNQPLTVIIGNIDLLLSQEGMDEERLRKTLETIKRASRNMADIVKKMSKIRRYETESYVGKVRILDLDKSSEG